MTFFHIKHLWQIITRGFSDVDTWSLDYTIAKFALPRLKVFKINHGEWVPSSLKGIDQWNEILDKIIFAMEITTKEFDGIVEITEKDSIRQIEGYRLFGKYFNNLWW